jgi:hypothetical protein
LYRRLGGSQSRSGRRGEEKILDPTDPSVVQPVASRYTDYAIPTPNIGKINDKVTILEVKVLEENKIR